MAQRLAYQRFGDGDGTPLLIAHGLFGSGKNWGALAKRLSTDRPVVTVDMRNHGASFRAETQSYEEMAADLLDVIEELGGQVDLLGHSMGGKAAMVAALQEPAGVARLIVADIAPVAYTHTHAPYIDAMRRLDLPAISRRSEADRALSADIADPALRAFLLQSLKFEAGAAPRWLLNLDALAREMPKILDLREVEGSFEGETLFLSGGASDYVQSTHRPLIRGLFPNARFEVIPGAGHWVHAEAPEPFLKSISAFLGPETSRPVQPH